MGHELVRLSKAIGWSEMGLKKRPPFNRADFSKFRKRAGIEPAIGYLKSDRRMIRNCLRGTLGDAINTLGSDS